MVVLKMTKNVAEFIRHNDIHPVISGWSDAYKDSKTPRGGYTTRDGKTFKFTLNEFNQLPNGYPKWDFSGISKD